MFFAGVLALVAAWPVQAQPLDRVPIITFDQTHPLFEAGGVLPMVRVYATGDVLVYRAPGYRNPGQYELTISPEELQALTRMAQQAGIAGFDETELVAELAESTEALLIESSDPTTSIFQFNRIAGADVLSAGDGTTTDAMQTIVLEDVSMAASVVPDSSTLDPLNELHSRLLDLFSQAGR